MCRNIRVLAHFEPATTPEEIRAAALQYVRKVSGTSAPKPSAADQAAFDAAVEEITKATQKLLGSLKPRSKARTRADEFEKAKKKWQVREARIKAPKP
jgi:hypothetical protein